MDAKKAKEFDKAQQIVSNGFMTVYQEVEDLTKKIKAAKTDLKKKFYRKKLVKKRDEMVKVSLMAKNLAEMREEYIKKSAEEIPSEQDESQAS